MGREHVVEVVLVDVHRFAVFQRGAVGTPGEIAHDEELERQLFLFLGVAGGGLVDDVDALFRSDGAVVSHGMILVGRVGREA